MSSSQVYPGISGTIDPQQMCGDASAGIVSTEWYAPSSYVYNDPYVTPYPSSTVESQPWNSYARASVPDLAASTYGNHEQPHQYTQSWLPAFKDPTRPRSSPSTFGTPNIVWPATSGLGIHYTSTAGQPTPVTSTFPPAVFQHYASEEQYGTASLSEIRAPQPRRPYTNIAPDPQGVASIKRQRDSDITELGSSKRRKRTASVASADLSEDDRFLVQLKEDEALPWKDIATRFHTDKGKTFQVAALQMRYKRLREKFRTWEEQDVSALKLALEYWEKYKWEIISAKMLEYGLTERWPPRQCARKWQEMEAERTTRVTAAGSTPGISQFSSPSESPMKFAFMPIQ